MAIYHRMKSIIAKKMKKPIVSDEEQGGYDKEMDKFRERYSKRYSTDHVKYKSPAQKYREMSPEQREKAKRKVEELRKEFPLVINNN